jgi:hypothetical protein
MERTRVFFVCSTLVTIAVLLVAGCTGPGQVPVTPVTTPAPTLSPTEAPVITTPIPTTAAVSSPAPITTPPAITSDDVTQHFMDIAFGSGNTKLDRLPQSPSANSPLSTISLFNGNSNDTALVQSFISQFNDLSATNQFSTNIKTTTNADIVIRFVSPAGMDAIPKESYTREIRSGSVSYARIGPRIIYINDDLKGDLRSHIVLRGILYGLGFPGETLKYPDSVFYYEPNQNTRLDLVDQKAVQIMYSTGLTPGMTVANVKNVIYLKTN